MRENWRRFAAISAPLFAALLGFGFWRARGFDDLNRLELPLATWINNLTGRTEWFDLLVIFFNNWLGEALFVLIIFAAYAIVAARMMPKPTDWRRVAIFGSLIFIAWVGANAIGDRLEPVFERPSPSFLMGEAHVDLEEHHGRKVKTESATSFPSNHGSVFFTVFFMCLLRWIDSLKRHWPVWLGLFLLAALLSMPRVFTGAHWVSDTLIGSVLVTWSVAALVILTPAWVLYKRVEDSVVRITDDYLGKRSTSGESTACR